MSCLLALLLCSLILIAPANADDPIYTDCPSNTKYTSGSAFETNRHALLASLPGVAAISSGFADQVIGAAPDQAYGLAQCRGDVNASDCLACLGSAAQDVTSKCPDQKSAMVIHEFCLLRHSNASFFGIVDT
ncbi:hypothetical protein EJB05_36189, partial [Eragrostis curvula]